MRSLKWQGRLSAGLLSRMSSYDIALSYVLNFEDSARAYATVPDNRGMVIAGINSLTWPTEYAAIAAAPQAARAPLVATFYLENYWLPLQCSSLASQDVANRLMDMAVNAGTGTAVRLLQKCAGSEQDGAMGPLTLAVANAMAPETLLSAYREAREGYYREIAERNPANAPYLAGWLRRAQA